MSDKKQFIEGRIVGGYSMHDSFKPELCPGNGVRGLVSGCGSGRCVDCCGVADDRDIIECTKCGLQWSEGCSFDEDFS